MKCLSLRMTRFRRRSFLIIIVVLILTFINLLLCMWKWQDNEFKLDTFELTFLRKRISVNQKPLTKAAWQSKANLEVLAHSKSGQRRTNRMHPKPTVHYRTVWGQRKNRISPVHHAMVRKEDRGPVTNEYKQLIARSGRLLERNGIISKTETTTSQAEHDLANKGLFQGTYLDDYIELQHTNANRTGGSEVPIQVFYSEQDAVKACELAGELCQAISKFKEKTAFVYTLTSNLNLFTEANSTLYVKAEFRENVKFITKKVFSCAVVPSEMPSSSSTEADGCRLPDIDPFDKSAMQYFLTMVPMACEKEGVLFTRYLNGSLEVVTNHDRGAPLKSISYQTIHRQDGLDWAFYLGKPKFLQYKGPVAEPNHDFIKIRAEFVNGMIQTDFHAQVIPKPAVLQRKATLRAGLPLNIIIVGLDQTSQATFQRLLPDSYTFLQDELQGFMFKGFSLVGEATTPQLTALLTGRTVEENCRIHEARTGFDGARTVDEWPFIFKTLKEHGYVTLFSEDAPPMGAFNLRLKGFREPPCDHYARPFWSAVPHNSDSGLHDKCLNSQPQHTLQLEYLKSLFRAYPRTPKFGFTFLSSLCHHDSIMPLGAAAKDFFEFFQSIRDAGFLNHTMFIVMGDHGARTGEFRSTIQGKLEERLPFLSIVLPASFRARYPQLVKNLKQNTKVIITPLDLHATFMHVLKYPADPSKTELTRGSSLFSAIHQNRTCQEAKIPEYFCPCVQWLPLNTTHAHVRMSTQHVADHINNLLAEDSRVSRLCARLEVDEILSAWQETPSVKVQAFREIKNGMGIGFGKPLFQSSSKSSPSECSYQVKFRTKPGYGKFEASVKVIEGHFFVNEHISRTNIYGSQPDCIKTSHPHLRKFCYCLHDS